MLLGAACQPATPPAATPTPSATALPTGTATLTPSPTATARPTATVTATPEACQAFGFLARPIPAEANPYPSPGYLYGSTADGTREPHHGVEFENPPGTPVLAAAEGTVYFAGNDSAEARFSPWTHFYGNLVVLEHDFCGQPIYTLYAHLSRIDVEEGETVPAGQPIGAVGMTGAAIGPHLHFEVRMPTTTYMDTRNPVLWLKPADPARRGALRGRIQAADGRPVHTRLTVQELTDGLLIRQFFVETYAPEKYPVFTGLENFALGDLSPGEYRIVLVINGKRLEKFVSVKDNQITDFILTIP